MVNSSLVINSSLVVNSSLVFNSFILLVNNKNAVENCVKDLISDHQFKPNQEIYKVNIDVIKSAMVDCAMLKKKYKEIYKNDEVESYVIFDESSNDKKQSTTKKRSLTKKQSITKKQSKPKKQSIAKKQLITKKRSIIIKKHSKPKKQQNKKIIVVRAKLE